MKKNRGKIISELLIYESYEAAEDEFLRAVDCLENIEIEKNYLIESNVSSVSAFTPINLPLYSLILFAIVPSLLSKKVYVRPPVALREIYNKLFNIINLNQDLLNIKISTLDRALFIEAYVSFSDVVLFTGKYENALKIINHISPNSLFIYNGAGINPIIINKDADLKIAVSSVIRARLFNSGQDCAGPDCILVHHSIFPAFIKLLKKKIAKEMIGDYNNKKIRIGKLLNLNYGKLKKYLDDNKENLVYGGKIDKKSSVVLPTILCSNIADKQSYFEPFSPVFNISIFNSESEMSFYFQNNHYMNYAMYVSIFGTSTYYKKIKNSVFLFNEIILDVERGNLPYGGYGPRANFVYQNGEYQSEPILISEQVYKWKSREKFT
ncbi:aldehyde dehydrogenase family protein [Candidatus Gracilibacteria bacterium]|nr:aldehyde dehydrogenase family protein [Candidatus Gracilibacteria bacterium]